MDVKQQCPRFYDQGVATEQAGSFDSPFVAKLL